jgi:hypothetical protein
MVADQVLNDCDHLNQRMRYYTNNLLSGVFLLEWHWLYNYSSWYTKSLKMDVLQTKLNLTVTLNQRMPLLRKQSVLRESFSWNGTDYTTNQAEFLQRMLLDQYWTWLLPLNQRMLFLNNLFWRVSLEVHVIQMSMVKNRWISRTKLDCDAKPADAVTTQTICSGIFSGMVLIIQLHSGTKNPSSRMYCWSVWTCNSKTSGCRY